MYNTPQHEQWTSKQQEYNVLQHCTTHHGRNNELHKKRSIMYSNTVHYSTLPKFPSLPKQNKETVHMQQYLYIYLHLLRPLSKVTYVPLKHRHTHSNAHTKAHTYQYTHTHIGTHSNPHMHACMCAHSHTTHTPDAPMHTHKYTRTNHVSGCVHKQHPHPHT